MKRLWLVFGGLFAVGLIIIVILILSPKPPIPGSIKSQLTSTLLIPQTQQVTIDRQSAKFDDNLKLLTFNLTYDDVKLVLSEQPTPQNFTDIPQVYDSVVQQMNEYTSFDVDVGTVHLTTPTNQGGKQVAVINTKGTLMFVKPNRNLSVDQWRRFFNAMIVER